ncbi:MAG: NUDIX domain-containing protein [Halobacteriovoraceae bacterium]|nr:NUDIX domain-containing protein [Halobacteriovoraceae bacterium]
MEKKFLRVSIGIFYRYIDNKPQIFLQRRNVEGALKNKLEFPGGKIEEFETPLDALIREMQEEVNVRVEPHEALFFKLSHHEYPETSVILHTYMIKKNVELENWYNLSDYESYKSEIPDANHVIFEDLMQFFGPDSKQFNDFSRVLWK